MKSLQHHLTEYVAARRSLGTRLEEPAQTLVKFVSFLARKNARFITIQFALEWAHLVERVLRAEVDQLAILVMHRLCVSFLPTYPSSRTD